MMEEGGKPHGAIVVLKLVLATRVEPPRSVRQTGQSSGVCIIFQNYFSFDVINAISAFCDEMMSWHNFTRSGSLSLFSSHINTAPA